MAPPVPVHAPVPIPAPLPNYNCSIEQFCAKSKALLEDDQASFVRFVLTGQQNGTQAVVDPILDRMLPHADITTRRDYDSVLGIDTDIRCSANLTISFIPKKEDTLTKNLHIKHLFEGPEFSSPSTPPFTRSRTSALGVMRSIRFSVS
ncbi:hypothetical protein NLJ89_g10319 [Agrocybe chaxingu]|uniref:Uncharacterized protein n=1 Tax=Agrocybe chaxingu TaxID=84603 RepID=A0A9W8JYE1_9AGAR|nr:hypothetical protein NLJ89_g10319 [Agrocybe chaxingu]